MQVGGKMMENALTAKCIIDLNRNVSTSELI